MADVTVKELREWIIESHHALNDVVIDGEEQVNVARRALYQRRMDFPTPDPLSLEIYDAADEAGLAIARAVEMILKAQDAVEVAKDKCAKAVNKLDLLSPPFSDER
jgi:hypothetical protein